MAFSRRVLHGVSEALGAWGLYAIAELNAAYLTDGSTRLFLSPGLGVEQFNGSAGASPSRAVPMRDLPKFTPTAQEPVWC